MRALLVSFGTRGDVQPLVALGLGLRAAGHQVVLGASPGFGDWVRGQGLEFHGVGNDIEAWIRDHGDLVSRPLRAMPATVEYLRRDTRVSFSQILDAARGADLLVSGIHAAAPSVAEYLGIPHRTILYCPQLLRSIHYPPPATPWLELPAAANRALWWASSIMFDHIFGEVLGRCRRELGLPAVRDLSAHVVPANSIVAADAALGALTADAPDLAIQIPALMLPATRALDPALERFLGDGEPPVVVGFGSMPDGDPRRTTRLIAQALAATGRRGVIVGGWAGLGAGELPRTILAVRGVPHALLLPRAALAVHHGGAGTTMAALRAGIPQVVVPHIADQFYWGHRVNVCGLGSRPIARNALTASKLAEAIRFVLENPRIGQRARQVGRELAGADGVAELTRILERIVEPGARHAA